jgi:rubrerythrin
MKKVTKKDGLLRDWLKRQIAEEHMSASMYRKAAKKVTTVAEKKRFLSMAKDEKRHAKYLQDMYDRRFGK